MHIPISTYRIQLNRDFGFKELNDISSYLGSLGISDVYGSPIFKARKSSAHGYDIVDPNSLNPELGSEKDFEELITALKGKGMNWLQDIVPNHMAFDSQNTMLMDILEQGGDSAFINFFDIDWDHQYENIKGRLLAPFLGKFFSEALENQEIKLAYNENGLTVNYFSISLPVRLESYRKVFIYNLEKLKNDIGERDADLIKFLGIIHTLKTLSFNKHPVNVNKDVSSRDIAFLNKVKSEDEYSHIKYTKAMLWDLYCQNEKIRNFIDENIRFFNGIKGLPESFDNLFYLLSEQLFRLSFWKVAAEEINYRRFFTINDLISLKIENEEVLEHTHGLIFRLIKEGKITGLRLDHIDGLFDPAEYLRRLRNHAPDTYVIAEKILNFNERLDDTWPIQGTTGYDFLNYLNGLFCKKENASLFSKLYSEFSASAMAYEDLLCEKKRLIIGKHMAGNIDNLAHMLKKISGNDRYGLDITLYGLKRALVEIMANFSIYRTYVNNSTFSGEDKAYITDALEKAKKRLPDYIYEINFIEKFLLLQYVSSTKENDKALCVDFIMNFQQFTAALMAKSYEDTFLYVYNRLLSLNEVGGYAQRFGITKEEFHDFNKGRFKNRRYSLNATSTHDVKRGEDIRARINVLSEMPKDWRQAVGRWSNLNKSRKAVIDGKSIPEGNEEYFLYQTLIGSYPFSKDELPDYTVRIKSYMVKALREAKVHTAWLNPNSEYEQAFLNFTDCILTPSAKNLFLNSFLEFQRKIAWFGMFNSLSQALLKITSVGAADFYQGTELWDLNLVDPDNRRKVDFQLRRKALNYIKGKEDISSLIKELFANKEDGSIKLFLIYRGLLARKNIPALFQDGEYIPLVCEGSHKENIIAFARKNDRSWAITIAPRFLSGVAPEGDYPCGASCWKDTRIILPQDSPAHWQEAISAEELVSGAGILAADAFKVFPAALLIGEN